MWNETTENAHGSVLNLKVLVLHTVKKHQQVLIARDERIKLRVEILEHSDTNTILVICSSCDEESVQELVYNTFHTCTKSLGAKLETQRTTGLHSFLSHLGVLVIKVVQH